MNAKGEEFGSMIHVMKYCRKKTCIYDATGEGNNSFKGYISLTQNSFQSDIHDCNQYANINKSQLRQQTHVNFPLSQMYIFHNKSNFTYVEIL